MTVLEMFIQYQIRCLINPADLESHDDVKKPYNFSMFNSVRWSIITVIFYSIQFIIILSSVGRIIINRKLIKSNFSLKSTTKNSARSCSSEHNGIIHNYVR